MGLMATTSNVIPFGLLYMRPLQWWLKTKGFYPRGNQLCMIKVTRFYFRALDMWRKPWFLSQGSVLGVPSHRDPCVGPREIPLNQSNLPVYSYIFIQDMFNTYKHANFRKK